MVTALKISRAQLAKICGNDHDMIRQFETLFSAVASQDTDATVVEPEILIETAGNLALARIERLERVFQMLELAPAHNLQEDHLGNPASDGMVLASTVAGARSWASNGSLVKLQETVLTEAAASVAFNSISQDYTNLKLNVLARCSTAYVGENICLRFNGDASNNYDRTYLFSNNTHGSGYEYAQINGIIGYIAADSATANYAGFVEALIPFYTRTVFNKIVKGHSVASVNSTSQTNQTFNSTQWRSTAAINSILVYPQSGSFKAGSTFVLYGEK